MSMVENRFMRDAALLKEVRRRPLQSTKQLEAALGWSQNMTQRYLKRNADKLVKGWVIK